MYEGLSEIWSEMGKVTKDNGFILSQYKQNDFYQL